MDTHNETIDKANKYKRLNKNAIIVYSDGSVIDFLFDNGYSVMKIGDLNEGMLLAYDKK